jgi:hypothetical protein
MTALIGVPVGVSGTIFTVSRIGCTFLVSTRSVADVETRFGSEESSR